MGAKNLTEIQTYADLLNALRKLTKSQLEQPVQVADPPCDGKPVELARGIALGTVGDFEFEGARSVADNKYHAYEVVLLIDCNPFAEDGAIAYEMKTAGDGKRTVHRMIPKYGKGGQTKRKDQYAPKRVEFPAHLGKTVARRSEDFKRS